MTSLQALIEGRQHARLLRLSFPNGDGPASELLVDRFRGSEWLSRDFQFDVELLSEDAFITLEDLQGKMLCISLVRGDGQLRHFTGRVRRFSFVSTDGGLAVYEAQLVPWVRYLELRRNNRLFHQQTLRDQVQTLFADYGTLPAWEWQVTGEQRQYTLCTQYDETDHNYLYARLEAEGLVTRYEHTEQGHTFIVGDTTLDAPPIEGAVPEIRFHAEGESREEDAIRRWAPRRRWASGQTVLSGFNFKSPRPVHQTVPTINPQGDIPALEVHSYEGHYGFTDSDDGRRLARQRMEEIEALGRQYEARGNNRLVAPGRWFKLTDHFADNAEDGGNEFLILEVHHHGCNNYRQAVQAPSKYKNRFVCQSRKRIWRPGRGFNSTRTRILAPQTATVVGPEGQGSLYVDAYGRVQVQFHWDRALSGSCWVRVSSNWAGAQNGLVSHPRVGSEVMIQWLDGNPDHPIVTSGFFNERYLPPWKLPEQRALTGLRSRELTAGGGNTASGRSNHVLLDDTDRHIQVQARSDHLASQLSLGSIHRIETNAGRTEPRGQGLEARSDGPGVVRTNGLLLTTEPRPGAQGHITDMPETLERLTQGQDLHASLSDAAQAAQAHDADDQTPVVEALKTQTSEIQGQGGNPAQNEFPEFAAAHLTLASPAGIQSTTQGSTHVASSMHTALTSGGHTSLSAGKSLLASVKNAIRLFAYQAGMKLVAAGGNIDIAALKDSITLLAKLKITHTAERIEITASQEVVLNGGGSYSRWNASGITHGTNGPWVEHAASFSMDGPASLGSPALPQATELPKGNLALLHQYVSRTGQPLRGVAQGEFSVTDSEGAAHGGALNTSGDNSVAQVPMGMVEVDYGEDPSDPWADSSYFNPVQWPPAGAEAADAAQTDPVASAAAALTTLAPAALQAAGTAQAIADGGAAAGAQALLGSAGRIAGAQAAQAVQAAAQGVFTDTPASAMPLAPAHVPIPAFAKPADTFTITPEPVPASLKRVGTSLARS
jgi:type VI secretion system secreted protein VgrG